MKTAVLEKPVVAKPLAAVPVAVKQAPVPAVPAFVAGRQNARKRRMLKDA